jgi:3,4-dihydroxy 2-butanone 4-phosphate synthase/GTP cyclohydrolase II
MVPNNADPLRTAYTVSVDAAAGVTTGISAADRATTLRVLGHPVATASDLIRPGHVLPLRAKPGGVFDRRGHTEATVDLCRLAGLSPVGAIGELVDNSGEVLRGPDVLSLGAQEGLPVITIADLVAWRDLYDRVEQTAVTTLPTAHGAFVLHGYYDRRTGAEHLALISPRGLATSGRTPLVRVHSECLTGDALGSRRCDCGRQLDESLSIIARQGGVIVYLRGHEGRGVGLLAKLSAYALQDAGADTVDAQTLLGLPVDAREYGGAAAILAAEGVMRAELLTNNPAKADGLRTAGIEITRLCPLIVQPTPDNRTYLSTKRDRMGHRLPAAPVLAQEA